MSDGKTDPIKRMSQIFAARLVLEVFGGGGAVWGFSEVLTWRNPETQEFWRSIAQVAGAIFMVRFLLQIKDYIRSISGTPSTLDNDRSFFRLLQVFSARFILEVAGGGGAIWGASEALTLRNAETVHFWRKNASVIAAIFFVRFLLQIKDFVRDSFPPADDKSFKRMLQIFSAKMVLEVLGGAGAIWGFSEVLTLRRPETQELWRFNALSVGFIFFIRFLLQIKDHVLYVHYGDSSLPFTMDQYIRLWQVFSARFVLEVAGGAGAIWGFSEAATFRVPETNEFWRFNALVVGTIFFVRFISQIKDSILEIKGPLPSPTKPLGSTEPSEQSGLVEGGGQTYN